MPFHAKIGTTKYSFLFSFNYSMFPAKCNSDFDDRINTCTTQFRIILFLINLIISMFEFKAKARISGFIFAK